ncbi:hypothetical protein [Zavarzinia sp. CC-PAN008]|uniref:hypothetical protein n=1 Tax=Zavarzinia sp. CC-PAN008 TaxID=3243332 RepID=UPI003F7456E9
MAHTQSFLLLSILVLVTVIAIYGLRTFAGLRQARLHLLGEAAYRDLAERATGGQAAAIAGLANVHAELAEVKSQLNRIERILQSVE